MVDHGQHLRPRPVLRPLPDLDVISWRGAAAYSLGTVEPATLPVADASLHRHCRMSQFRLALIAACALVVEFHSFLKRIHHTCPIALLSGFFIRPGRMKDGPIRDRAVSGKTEGPLFS